MGSSAGRQLFGIFGICASLAAALFGGGAWGLQAWAIEEAQESTTWPTTAGTITSADVERVRIRNGRRVDVYAAEADLRYAYVVDGVEHVGTRETLGGAAHRWRDEEQGRREVQRMYPVGSQVTVWYRPTNPRLAVLQPGGAEDDARTLVLAQGVTVAGGLGLLLVPVAWLAWGLVARPRR